MTKFISKQKYSFHNGVQEFVIPLNEPVEVPSYVQDHFLFRMALKSGVIIELADARAKAGAKEAEAKTEAKEAEAKTEAKAKTEANKTNK